MIYISVTTSQRSGLYCSVTRQLFRITISFHTGGSCIGTSLTNLICRFEFRISEVGIHILGKKWSKLLFTLTPLPPFSFLDNLLGKGGVQKWGFTPGIELGPPAPQCTAHPWHATWVLLPGQWWCNQTYRIFFTSHCWVLLNSVRLGFGNKKCYALLTLNPFPFCFLGKGGVQR